MAMNMCLDKLNRVAYPLKLEVGCLLLKPLKINVFVFACMLVPHELKRKKERCFLKAQQFSNDEIKWNGLLMVT